MDLALNNLQRLICHRTNQPNKQTTRILVMFFQTVDVSVLLYGCPTLTLPKEQAWWKLLKDAAFCFEQIQEATSCWAATLRPLISHLINHRSKTNKTCWALAVEIKTLAMFSYGLLHMDTLVSSKQQKLAFIKTEDAGARWEDLPRGMTIGQRMGGSQENPCWRDT